MKQKGTPMQAPCLIKNAHVVSPGRECLNASILIEGGKIAAVHSDGAPLPTVEMTIDAQGDRVVPGFIDLHTHGAAGHDFCDATPATLRGIAKAKLREGVTRFLPTTLTIPKAALEETFLAGREYFNDQSFARIPGAHVEGPFINPQCTGAQNPAFVRPPDLAEIEILDQILPIKIVSLAVEMPGGLELVKALNERGIVASLAHTAATFEQFSAAKQAGARHLTHFCNQMTPLHHREIGLVGAGLLDNDVLIEMICDGIHLQPEMIQLAFKVIGPERIMLITDSIAASGMSDQQVTRLGELEVTIRDGVARLASGALAGSTLRLNRALRNVIEFTGLPLRDLIRTTSLNQAESLGLSDLGKIEPGYLADLVILDAEYEPRMVFVEGNLQPVDTP